MNRSSRRTGPRSWGPFTPALCGWVFLGLFTATMGLSSASGQSKDSKDSRESLKRYMMPSVTLKEFVSRGTQTIHAWRDGALPEANDRAKLYESFRQLLASYDEFQAEVGKIYPENQLEWLLITDSVADTLAHTLHGVLETYRDRNTDEILTEGRQQFEQEMNKIVGPPARVLGFHVVLLADHAYQRADELLASPNLEDKAGVYDGVLRHALDWTNLWMQVHDNPLSIYESRLKQEDWILVRIEDNCGNTGKWKITEQYMAMIGIDSTVTPPVERFAHEFRLVGQECEDERVIYIDLPNFNEMQRYVIENDLMSQ